jgi:hypothetical protein
MANFSDLPAELWLLIAGYLPKSQLFQLKSLNSLFLNCWMDMAWERVQVTIDSDEFPDRNIDLLLRVVYVHKKNLMN